MPVAIRIDPRNPDNEEVFTLPQLDSDSTDTLRKSVKGRMWFNMLDAQYHESVTHLGFTHVLMDGVSACMHRNLSERHPLYKLMLPHFRYMHFINSLATKELIQPGGYVDRDMYFGQRNMMKLIAKQYNVRSSSSSFISLTPTSVVHEGVPEFDSIANVVNVLTKIIYICSVEHSATNFPQYEQYAFPPNMPAILSGQPELENGVHELDEAMPTGQQIFSTIKIMMVLTTITTNSLGNYETKYLSAMDPAGRRIVQNFQHNLITVRDIINQRNNSIENSVHQINEYPYEWLLPANVRNSISI